MKTKPNHGNTKKTKAWFLLFLLAILPVHILAEGGIGDNWDFTRKGMNTFYFELGGNGFLYSLNYERFLSNHLGIRIGGSILPIEGMTGGVTFMGINVSGHNELSLESGLGLTAIGGSFIKIATDDTTSMALIVTGTIGVRYQSKRLGWIFRFGFTPLVCPSGIIPFFGISIGKSRS